ncbi:hypothetical protein ABZ671_24475 [Micromonospora sp. NPDC006766]|uniref:hypothetical protein n=1 Tax=Micromonospora sp. NPDC006766 TaxID=3154778 RepID=UPI0033C5D801
MPLQVNFGDTSQVMHIDAKKSGSITVSWRMVAFVCMLLAAGSTGTLAIVVPVKDVDTLSTIALALAILAFVIQIIIFVVQSWTSGQQMLQSEAINSDTRSLLTELRESAKSTNQLLANQYDKILERLLLTTERAVNETATTGAVNLDELRSRLERDLRQALNEEIHSPTRSSRMDRLSSEQRARLNYLETYPRPSQLDETLHILLGLSPLALATLLKFGRDAMSSIINGRYEGFHRRDIGQAADELERLNLIAVAKDVSLRGSEQLLVLTPAGRKAVRPLTAIGRPPLQFEDELLGLRKQARQGMAEGRQAVPTTRQGVETP